MKREQLKDEIKYLLLGEEKVFHLIVIDRKIDTNFKERKVLLSDEKIIGAQENITVEIVYKSCQVE